MDAFLAHGRIFTGKWTEWTEPKNTLRSVCTRSLDRMDGILLCLRTRNTKIHPTPVCSTYSGMRSKNRGFLSIVSYHRVFPGSISMDAFFCPVKMRPFMDRILSMVVFFPSIDHFLVITNHYHCIFIQNHCINVTRCHLFVTFFTVTFCVH
nr:MAG TPA: hypothetical protein [Caudoviricetes sp.]